VSGLPYGAPRGCRTASRGVMTFELRDFGVVAAEGTITIVPGSPPRR
jgi:hypothetical protein